MRFFSISNLTALIWYDSLKSKCNKTEKPSLSNHNHNDKPITNRINHEKKHFHLGFHAVVQHSLCTKQSAFHFLETFQQRQFQNRCELFAHDAESPFF